MATPKNLLVLAGLFLFGLLGPVWADKPAVPEYLNLPGYMGLASKDIQKEIGLTEEQLQKLKEISKEAQATPWKQPPQVNWTKMTEAERKKALEEMQKNSKKWTEEYQKRTAEARKKIEAVLTPEQRSKLQDIELRMVAGSMLLYGSVGEKLALTDQQKEQLKQNKDQLQKKLAELQQQMQKAQDQATQAAFKMLTPEQLEQLKKFRQEGYRWGHLTVPKK